MPFFRLLTSVQLLSAEGRPTGQLMAQSETTSPLPTGMSPSSELGLCIGAGVVILLFILVIFRRWLPFDIWDATKGVYHCVAGSIDGCCRRRRTPITDDGIPMDDLSGGGANPVEGPQHPLPDPSLGPIATLDIAGEDMSQSSLESVTPTVVEQEHAASASTLVVNEPTPHIAPPTVRQPRPSPPWRLSEFLSSRLFSVF